MPLHVSSSRGLMSKASGVNQGLLLYVSDGLLPIHDRPCLVIINTDEFYLVARKRWCALAVVCSLGSVHAPRASIMLRRARADRTRHSGACRSNWPCDWRG